MDEYIEQLKDKVTLYGRVNDMKTVEIIHALAACEQAKQLKRIADYLEPQKITIDATVAKLQRGGR